MAKSKVKTPIDQPLRRDVIGVLRELERRTNWIYYNSTPELQQAWGAVTERQKELDVIRDKQLHELKTRYDSLKEKLQEEANELKEKRRKVNLLFRAKGLTEEVKKLYWELVDAYEASSF